MQQVVLPESIVICALARDCADSLIANIPRIESLRKHFLYSEVIVIENDSKDNTKEVLVEWQNNFTGVNLISEDYDTETFLQKNSSNPNPGTSIYRIQKMAAYRNMYMDWIAQRNRQFDYVMMIDIDVADFSIQGIMDSLANAPKDWAGIFANGYTNTNLFGTRVYRVYHDLYALLIKKPAGLPFITFPQMFRNSKEINGKMAKTPYLPVISAFGGLGIYKYDLVFNLKYKCIENKDHSIEAVCEHIPFNMEVCSNAAQNYIARNMEVYYGETNKLMVLRNLLPLKLFKLLALLVTFKKLKA